MRQSFLVSLVAMVLTIASSWAGENQATNMDNNILALALADGSSGDGYVVVYPKADLSGVSRADSAESIKDALGSAAGPGTNAVIGLLVDQLFERNKGSGTRQAVRLTLDSSLTNGYVIDYDGKYLNYLRNDGGGYSRLYKENPKVRGFVTITLPAYDEKSGLVVLCKGTSKGGLQGWGEAILYRFENGRLRKLKSVPLWIA